MELKFVIPNMEKTFGNLEFAGDKVQRRINGRLTVLSRSYNLYSDVQRKQMILWWCFLLKLAKNILALRNV